MQCWEFWIFVWFAERTKNPSQCSQCTTQGLLNIKLWRTLNWINCVILVVYINVPNFCDCITSMLLLFFPQYAAREAEIVAQAGRKNSITIATNMAGRGTDIILGGNPKVSVRIKLDRCLRSIPKSHNVCVSVKATTFRRTVVESVFTIYLKFESFLIHF